MTNHDDTYDTTNNTNDTGPVEPEHTNESMANDRFMHGLLGFMHHDSTSEKERRIKNLLAQLDQPAAPKHRRFHLKLKKLIPLASAAMIMLIAFTIFVISPQPKAYAIVNNAIQATQTVDSLRYEIRKSDDESGLIGTLDMQGTRSRIHITTPHGHEFVMGRDDQGEWSIRRDGTVERYTPRAAAPRWLNTGESTILIASLDEFLIQLKDDYSVENVTDNTSDIIHLHATRLPNIKKPGPDQISVWINPDSLLVDRLELSWNRRPGGQSSTRPNPRTKPESRPGPRTGSRPGPGPGPGPDSERGPLNRRPPPPHLDPMEDAWFPELLGSPPMFDEGRNPPPPPLIIFQRVDPIDLPDESYSPPSP